MIKNIVLKISITCMFLAVFWRVSYGLAAKRHLFEVTTFENISEFLSYLFLYLEIVSGIIYAWIVI